MSIHFDKPKSSPSTRVGLMCTDGACPILNELQTYGILQRCVLLNNEKSDDASSIMQAVEKVASGKLDYAVAIVKKHGDDLENEATGFGLGKYANIATRFIRGEKLDYGIHKNKSSCENVGDEFSGNLRKKTDAYCIEVSLEDGCFGDPDSSAIVDHILIPVAMDFKPDMIIILVGLDEGNFFGNEKFLNLYLILFSRCSPHFSLTLSS
ncbi:hypothetical protein ACJIZ3_005374 [Penstemon smallii]|uniref:Uncharacterized protein n=1 Tax=Penstemon smallii TaxID=265156 RepID=A0ABD3S4N8_9LAMI